MAFRALAAKREKTFKFDIECLLCDQPPGPRERTRLTSYWRTAVASRPVAAAATWSMRPGPLWRHTWMCQGYTVVPPSRPPSRQLGQSPPFPWSPTLPPPLPRVWRKSRRRRPRRRRGLRRHPRSRPSRVDPLPSGRCIGCPYLASSGLGGDVDHDPDTGFWPGRPDTVPIPLLLGRTGCVGKR